MSEQKTAIKSLSAAQQGEIQWLPNGFAVKDSGDGATNTLMGITPNGELVVIGKLPKADAPKAEIPPK